MKDQFVQTRTTLNLTQEEFSEKLLTTPRAYAAIEHGDSFCRTITFILYLVYFCKDVDLLISDLREIIINSLGEDE